MSTGLSALAIIEFDALLKAAYQKSSMLRPYVRLKTGVTGTSIKFRRAVRGVAMPRLTQTEVVPMGTTYGDVTATLTKWQAVDYIDYQDMDDVNFSEMPILAENVAGAIGRREDQLIIDALGTAETTASILHGGTSLTFAKLTAARELFVDRAIPMQDWNLLISAKSETALLNEAKLTSTDYVSKGAIESGRLPPKLLGFTVHVLDSARDEGGLPLVAGTPNVRTNFAWDRQAVGLALSGMSDRVTVKDVAHMNSQLIGQFYTGGAVVIDPRGVIEIETAE